MTQRSVARYTTSGDPVTLPADIESWVRWLTLLPIAACSLVGLAVTIAKWLQLRRTCAAADRLIALVRARASGDRAAVLQDATADPSIPARLVEYALSRVDGPRQRLVESLEHAGRQLARRVERGLDTVALIATLGPLLGLFGTVVGIVIVFDTLAGAETLVSPGQLAGGIGTALYTTVAGLIVGMCALVSHRFLTTRADEAIARLETLGQALVERQDGEEA